jgi:hypothetical protein
MLAFSSECLTPQLAITQPTPLTAQLLEVYGVGSTYMAAALAELNPTVILG